MNNIIFVVEDFNLCILITESDSKGGPWHDSLYAF